MMKIVKMWLCIFLGVLGWVQKYLEDKKKAFLKVSVVFK